MMKNNSDFDRQQERMFLTVGAWFCFVAILAVAILGGLAWAGYELIQWVTSK